MSISFKTIYKSFMKVFDDALVAAGLLDDARSMLPRLNNLLICALDGNEDDIEWEDKIQTEKSKGGRKKGSKSKEDKKEESDSSETKEENKSSTDSQAPPA